MVTESSGVVRGLGVTGLMLLVGGMVSMTSSFVVASYARLPRASVADAVTSYTPPASADMGFNYIQLRTNTVARWEYKPGSTVFLVWAHGRQRGTSQQMGTWRDDYRDLFELHPDNTFLIKVAYWLSR
jgi:hypothetical protein